MTDSRPNAIWVWTGLSLGEGVL